MEETKTDAKKAVLFYYSMHHGNTKKIAEEIAEKLPVEIVSIPTKQAVDLGEYDLVGFASGIYMSSFGAPMRRFAESLTGLSGKRCFTLYTCGAPAGEFSGAFSALLKKKGAEVAGGWHCRGYDTFGPFKLVGGIAKGRPSEADLESAVRFVGALVAK